MCVFQTEYSTGGFVDRRPGPTKESNQYVICKLIDSNWILFNDNLVQYNRNIGIVHRINLVMYRKSMHTTAYHIGLSDLSKRSTSCSNTIPSTESKRSMKANEVIYKTKLMTHAEDLAGLFIFKIK